MQSFTDMIGLLDPQENLVEAKSLAFKMKSIPKLWELIPGEIVLAIFMSCEQDAILFMGQALIACIDGNKSPANDIGFLSEAAAVIGKGIVEFYPEIRLDQMCDVLKKITKVIGKDAMTEIMHEAYGTTSDEIDPENHVKIETVGYVAATCETDGYSGDVSAVKSDGTAVSTIGYSGGVWKGFFGSSMY